MIFKRREKSRLLHCEYNARCPVAMKNKTKKEISMLFKEALLYKKCRKIQFKIDVETKRRFVVKIGISISNAVLEKQMQKQNKLNKTSLLT